jgi:predicted protein tyrosine phosphatase
MCNILFICSQNRLRSPTAQQVFCSYESIQCLSAGLDHDAITPVSSELIDWAELIFVMEKSHRNKLTAKFKSHLSNKRVICLDIPDEYDFMDSALIRLLQIKVTRFLPTIINNPVVK